MKPKQYTLEIKTRDGSKKTLSYGYNLRFKSWCFHIDNVRLLLHLKGNEIGHKVANIISGSVRRTGKIDNLCRANINSIVG